MIYSEYFLWICHFILLILRRGYLVKLRVLTVKMTKTIRTISYLCMFSHFKLFPLQWYTFESLSFFKYDITNRITFISNNLNFCAKHFLNFGSSFMKSFATLNLTAILYQLSFILTFNRSSLQNIFLKKIAQKRYILCFQCLFTYFILFELDN